MQRSVGRVLALLSTALSVSVVVLLLSLLQPDPRPKALIAYLLHGVFGYLDDYVEDVARVADFAEQLRGASLTSAQIAEMEKLIGFNTVPLILQKNFVEKALGLGGEYDAILHSADASPQALSRVLNTVDTISARYSKAYQDKASNPQLREYWDRVERHVSAHQYWTLGEGECNGTILAEGRHVYRLTAHNCVEQVFDKESWAVDVGRDLAVQYVPPAEFRKWKVRGEGEALTGENKAFMAIDELPRIARNIAQGQMRGRLIFSNGYGRDYSYYRRIVRKVHFSFLIEPPVDNSGAIDFYLMILPLAESARWVHPGVEVGAKGSSGSVVVDAGTGQIVGVLSSVIVPPYRCEHICNFLGRLANAQHVFPLLKESRSRAGLQ
jgi:hypothetical protein